MSYPDPHENPLLAARLRAAKLEEMLAVERAARQAAEASAEGWELACVQARSVARELSRVTALTEERLAALVEIVDSWPEPAP